MFKLYNSYSRELEEFRPMHKHSVKMYSCGPTVYDYIHIGNLRTFLFSDVLRRYLEFKGFKVEAVMNLTDVGHMLGDADVGADKVEEAAAKAKLSPQAVTQKYSEYFFETIKAFNIKPAKHYPKATENITQMIEMVKTLLEKGYAYQVGGDIYYDVAKFANYGQLSGNTLDKLNAGARVEVNDKKKNPLDFALWINNPNHLMQWPSPWGSGYPGWHIECSAMATRFLGETLDIHTGGEDNKFPHHECEIAQTEGATGKRFANYWLHASHLLVDGAKMSKSLNNFYKREDLEAKGYDTRTARYALTCGNYREQQNFTFAGLDSAKSALSKLDVFYTRLCTRPRLATKFTKSSGAKEIIEVFERDFASAMDDDLNVSKALGALFVFVREFNSSLDEGMGWWWRHHARKTLEKTVEGVLGLPLKMVIVEKVPVEISSLVAGRETARKAKDYVLADALRKELAEKGWTVEDSANGPVAKKI